MARPNAPTTRPQPSSELREAKDLFYSATAGHHEDVEPALRLLDRLGGRKSADPQVLAYMGAAELLKAKNAAWILEKTSLAQDGLSLEDRAVREAPGDLEIRFLRGATNYELPRFMGRWTIATSDLAYVAQRAEKAASAGRLDPRAAAAGLDYQGRIFELNYQLAKAIQAWRAAVRVARDSRGGLDAIKHLAEHHLPA